ncbi:phosphatase PAP2 family protein [Streptomyces sp. H10-C2]|uniref:phosphatase PAP2 family protein n=1 Tax=unclassified Streptomyces TaxID=2593676 RepID=UPI0024B8CD05|nr:MULTISPECIES: phosphatase PAP2 family protein [unclassified Streptomyces]MDJ0347322.1 phosphatase PAP2 family protein [Streptomyces sp. PH10-H1]MDJ0375119.1 phosphatase PAP2 family protein [Streptomyces sp. H10-C2]
MTPALAATSVLALDGPSVDGDWYTRITHLARHTTWLNGAVDAYTTYGVVLFGLALVAACLVARRATDPRVLAAALGAPITTALAMAVNATLKTLVSEQRPCRAIAGSFTVEPCPGAADYSFPSNHAAMAGAVAAAVFLVNWRLGVLTSVAALLMAASRVWVGVHYPHDVLVGLAVGAGIALAGYAALRPVLLRLVAALTSTPLRPLLVPNVPVEHPREI